MARCLVNERPELTEIRPETWESLLEALDARLAADRLVVTAVRFDGVDQPSFREPAVGATPLDGIAQVDIDAEDAVGAAALYALKDGHPMWIRISQAPGMPGTIVEVSGAVVVSDSAAAATVAPAAPADSQAGS